MTLFARLVIGIISLIAIAVISATEVIHSSFTQSYAIIERDAAHKELARLLKTMESEARALSQLLLGWAHWTDMYDYVASRNPEFRAENLGPDTLGPSDLSWVVIIAADGAIVDAIGQDPLTKQPLPLDTILQPDSPSRRALTAPLSDDGFHCGVLTVAANAYLACRMSIRDTQAELPSRGIMVLARQIDDAMTARIEDESQLLFLLSMPATPEQPGRELLPSEPVPSAVFGAGTATVETAADRLILRQWLQDMTGQPFAQLELSVDRQISERGRAVLGQTEGRVLIVSLVLIAALVFAIDRLLVLRLRRMARELSQIRHSRDWSKRLDDHQRDEISRVANHANALLDVISKQMAELEQLSLTDSLTGLANRRAFDQRLELALRQHRRHATPLSLILLDLDRFKSYNDRYGHSMGDAALKQVARTMSRCAGRAGDLPARVGGEEFAVLLENCDLDVSHNLAEQLRQAVAALELPHMDSDTEVLTVSLGVVSLYPDEDAHHFYARADQALYRAKRLGRNRVEVDNSLSEPVEPG